MVASSGMEAPRTRRRPWLWVLVALIVLIGLYTAGWYYAASVLKANVLRTLGKQDAAGITGECVDMGLGGFPFGIGLSCAKVTIDDHSKGMSASFVGLSSSARVYAPGDITWTLQSPAEFRTAQGLTVSAEWQNLQSELTARGSGIQQTATVIDGLKAGIVSSFDGRSMDFGAARTEIHARQNGDDLEATIGLEGANAVIKDFPQPLPTLAASLDVTLKGKAGLLDGSDPTGQPLRGTSGLLHHMVADIGDGRTIKLSGPFSFDDQGYVSGQFKLEIDQVGPWRDGLVAIVPAAKHTIDLASKLLRGLAAGGDSVSVDLTADHGAVSLSGFIPLGRLPPI